MSEQTAKLVIYNDINFAIEHWPCNDHVHDFKVYEITGWTESGKPVFCNQFVDIINENTEVFLSGSIKWDGCSDWQFDEQERCMLHFCSKDEAANIGKLFERMYEIAKSEIKG